jgi:hypothetical protein
MASPARIQSFDRIRGPTEGAVSSVTGAQRTRLVLALGALNIILATVALGLAGSLGPTDQTARVTPTPSVSAPPIAGGSPGPSGEPTTTEPPVTEPTVGPGETPEASGPAASGGPAPTSGPGPIAAASGTPPTPAPTNAAPPTPAPTAAPVTPSKSKAKPPCPAAVEGAPGLAKGAGDASRPCQGGEGKGSHGSSGDDHGRGDERGKTRVNPCRGRRRREVA